MDKLESRLGEILLNLITGVDDVDRVIYDTVNVFTPKLQWKSKEITNNGESTLVAAIYSLKNYHCSIQIYEYVDKLAQVYWNHRASFTGTLEECKQFCSDKILNDFLKLCK